MLSATVTLTDAQIKALPTTPIEILPAVAGKANIIFFVLMALDTTGGPYSNVDPTNNLYCVNDINGNYDVVTNSAITPFGLDRADDHQICILNAVYGAALAGDFAGFIIPIIAINNIANWANKPTYLVASNGALNNYTGGNAANTLKVTTFYATVDA